MNIRDLEEKLVAAKIRPDSYSLTGGLPNEAFCIGNVNGRWEVYYSERGSKTSLKTFQSEDEACRYFYDWLTSSLKKMNLL